MNWKPVVGCLLIVLLGLALPALLRDLSFSAYGLGKLAGAVVIAFVGVGLIRSGRRRAGRRAHR